MKGAYRLSHSSLCATSLLSGNCGGFKVCLHILWCSSLQKRKACPHPFNVSQIQWLISNEQNGVELMLRVLWGWVIERIGSSWLSSLDCFLQRKSPTSHEDTRTSCGEELGSPVNSQHHLACHEWATLEVNFDPSPPLGWLQPWLTAGCSLTPLSQSHQPSHFQIPDPQKMWEIRFIVIKPLCFEAIC